MIPFLCKFSAAGLGNETRPSRPRLLRGPQHPSDDLAAAEHRSTPQFRQLAGRKSSGNNENQLDI